MNVFINDVPLIIKKFSDKVYKHKYDLVLGPTTNLPVKTWWGMCWCATRRPLFWTACCV